jgi:DNA mismatch endonuclease (patch repair protein)
LGLRYSLDNTDLPGSPDLANRRRRFAVFVHGCFWHRHVGCNRTTTPKTNRSFWEAKFDANVKRDHRVIRQLRALGFRVFVIWECDTMREASVARLTKRLSALLG